MGYANVLWKGADATGLLDFRWCPRISMANLDITQKYAYKLNPTIRARVTVKQCVGLLQLCVTGDTAWAPTPALEFSSPAMRLVKSVGHKSLITHATVDYKCLELVWIISACSKCCHEYASMVTRLKLYSK